MTRVLTPEIKAGIFAGESGGDYDTLFGFSHRAGKPFEGTKLTDMTVDEAIRFSDPRGPYAQWVKDQIGRVATPMGGYQIVGTTLRAMKNSLGLKGDEKMTPELQDRLGQQILTEQGTGAWEGYRGPKDPSTINMSAGGTTLTSTPHYTSEIGPTESGAPLPATTTEPAKPQTPVDKMAALANNPAIQALAKAFGGGKDKQVVQSDQDIRPSAIGADMGDAGRVQAAQAMMAGLMNKKRQMQLGTNLTSLPRGMM